VPGRSWLHRASPLPKLAWLGATLLVVLVTFEPVVLLLGITAGVGLALSSGTGRVAARTAVAVAPVAASIVVIQALAPAACRPVCTAVTTFGPFTIYAEGLSRALVLVARLLALELVTVPLLGTMHPADLFAALRRLRLPYEGALMLSLSLQLIPVLRRELDEVLAAQRARGFRGRGLGALAQAVVPVVGAAFDRMSSLVMGLEARGLGATGPRTSYRRVALGPAGMAAIALAAVVAILGVGAAVARAPSPPWTGSFPPPVAIAIVAAALVTFVLVLARGARTLAGH
jgi:energy-coupling factor transporter transmembrane protein EcfT